MEEVNDTPHRQDLRHCISEAALRDGTSGA